MDLQLYSVREVCALLKISRTSLYEQATLGHIPLRKIGAKTVVASHDLNDFIENLPKVQASVGRRGARR